jgi:hypothetical protein
VAALEGRLRVHTAAGILVSNVAAGMALALTPQIAGQAAPSSLVGCLLKMDEKWILYDTVARIVVELLGSGFEKEWGNRVQVNGTARAAAQPAASTVQVLDVTSVTLIEAGGCIEVARIIGARLPPAETAAPQPPVVTAPRPPAGGGMSAGTKVAIIGGAAGGAVGAALATRSSRSN